MCSKRCTYNIVATAVSIKCVAKAVTTKCVRIVITIRCVATAVLVMYRQTKVVSTECETTAPTEYLYKNSGTEICVKC